MTDWRSGADLSVIKARAELLRSVRAFFYAREVLEVETPLLGATFGTEPAIEPLRSEFIGPGYAKGRSLFLQSSPEFFMKRMLADGSPSIYQVAKAFRNGEQGRRHNPEFSILEWYRLDFSADQLMQELGELMRALTREPDLPIVYQRYADLVQQHLGLDVFEADEKQLAKCALDHNIATANPNELDKDAWLELLFSVVIEPALDSDVLTFVTHYPASQASLAQLDQEDPRTALRFELYYRGLELANGFEELADAQEQSERFEHENCRRRAQGQQVIPVDAQLLSALERGLPRCSGVAVGLDRVLMCLLGKEHLDDVLTFSFQRL
jgi:lysyl-tRNA synthetase class 2